MDFYIGTILPWAVPFAPQGWQLCQGQTLQVNQYQAVYSLISTIYGGSGTNFMLPNLMGRVPVGAGQLGMTNYTVGTALGAQSVTLSPNQVPMVAHTHPFAGAVSNINVSLNTSSLTVSSDISIPATTDNGTANNLPAEGNILGVPMQGLNKVSLYRDGSATPTVNICKSTVTGKITGTATGTTSITPAGAVGANNPYAPTVPVNLYQPSLVINYIFCMEGVYPTRP